MSAPQLLIELERIASGFAASLASVVCRYGMDIEPAGQPANEKQEGA